MNQEQIAGVVQGEREAFRLFYDEYFEYAMRTASLIVRQPEWAKDAVQEAFLRVYRFGSQYNPAKPFKPWFYCILLRECYRVMEREKKVIPFGEQLEHMSVEAGMPDMELDVYEALQGLDDLYRIPLILKYLHDYSEKEIAHVLEVNVNTLKSRLLKGREKMRNKLGGTYDGSEA